MQHFVVNAPGAADSPYCSTAEAARFLGVGDDTFEELAEAEGWVRPVYPRPRIKRWLVMDVVCLAHLLQRRQEAPKG